MKIWFAAISLRNPTIVTDTHENRAFVIDVIVIVTGTHEKEPIVFLYLIPKKKDLVTFFLAKIGKCHLFGGGIFFRHCTSVVGDKPEVNLSKKTEKFILDVFCKV